MSRSFSREPTRWRFELVWGSAQRNRIALDWEYDFHGSGCRLTHRGTGEAIDVDFFGRTGEYFDVLFYTPRGRK